jgi:hypothetical protein
MPRPEQTNATARKKERRLEEHDRLNSIGSRDRNEGSCAGDELGKELQMAGVRLDVMFRELL